MRTADHHAQRVVRHAGRPKAARLEIAPTRTIPLASKLEPGRTVAEALFALLDAAHCTGGMVELSGGFLDPLRFVIPANSSDPAYAVYYSETYEPDNGARLECAWCSLGWKNDKRFSHCHGIWRTSDGHALMGHLLGSETVVKEAVTVRGFGAMDSTFTVTPDEETSFSLFAVTPSSLDVPDAPAALVRLRPNVDLIEAVEQAANAIGLKSGALYGIGSFIDLHFKDGRMLPSDAIEIMITEGRFSLGQVGAEVDHVDVTGVGTDGSIKSGRLERGTNRVCVTAELLIVGDSE